MEKILRRLVISPEPITDTIRDEQDAFAEAASITGVVKITNHYRHVEDLLEHLELEADEDIRESSLQKHVADDAYHNIHLVLTDDDWKDLGIRRSLWGQSREMPDKQIITYGRWSEDGDYQVSHKHPNPVDDLPEAAIGAWHELDHGLRAIWNIDPTSTHYHFYGYATMYKNTPKKRQDEIKPRRYVRKPDVLEAWRALPWERLESKEAYHQEDKQRALIALLLQLVALLTKLLARKQAKLVKPLREWDTARITQPYGNYNPSIYTLTGHHIGVDHAVPVGTPLYAPDDGTIVEAGYNRILGNYYVYQYAHNRYLVNLHLQKKPKEGAYKAGDVLGYTGETGLVTGAHSHTEVFSVQPTRAQISDLITSKNWREITLDPMKTF